jgi:hypothetical protein
LAEGVDHRFLHHVFGVLLVQQDAVGQSVQSWRNRLIQAGIGGLIALQAARDQRQEVALVGLARCDGGGRHWNPRAILCAIQVLHIIHIHIHILPAHSSPGTIPD